MVTEPTMIGVSASTHPKLKELKDSGHFKEMADAYKFAIGLALVQGVIPPPISSQTVFSVATIDPDQHIKNAIKSIFLEETESQSVYRLAERLADWGIQDLFARSERGDIDYIEIFDQISEMSK